MRKLVILILWVGCGGEDKPKCAQTIDAYCASGALCNWSDYQDHKKYNCQLTTFESCGAYNVANQHGVDTGSSRYYDAATGKLVAVIGYSANFGGSSACQAGPSGGFLAPKCSDPTPSACDGGL